MYSDCVHLLNEMRDKKKLGNIKILKCYLESEKPYFTGVFITHFKIRASSKGGEGGKFVPPHRAATFWGSIVW